MCVIDEKIKYVSSCIMFPILFVLHEIINVFYWVGDFMYVAWYKNLTVLVSRIIRKLEHRCGARGIVQLCIALISGPLDPWMCLCRFMIHRVIDWCVAKTTNSTIDYFVFSQNLLVSSEKSNIVADPDVQRNHSTPLLLIRWSYECIYVNSCFTESLIGVSQKRQILPSPILSSLRTIYVWSALDLLVTVYS